MFHRTSGSQPSEFVAKEVDTVISLKAETHNFPTTVEPFNGAATGSGGEIRDRIAGGKGSFPIAGTACYMTSYPRFNEGVEATAGINAHLSTEAGKGAADLADESCAAAMAVERDWEKTPARPWLYQSPQEILTKASNGASDFGNKFGQCIICGSLLTAELEAQRKFGFDKVIMLAGGVGYAKNAMPLRRPLLLEIKLFCLVVTTTALVWVVAL
jgi:phosphoribosylformylglycinamidine synthase